MGMLASLRDLMWHVVNRDDGVEQRYDDEEQQAERKIVEEYLLLLRARCSLFVAPNTSGICLQDRGRAMPPSAKGTEW